MPHGFSVHGGGIINQCASFRIVPDVLATSAFPYTFSFKDLLKRTSADQVIRFHMIQAKPPFCILRKYGILLHSP